MCFTAARWPKLHIRRTRTPAEPLRGGSKSSPASAHDPAHSCLQRQQRREHSCQKDCYLPEKGWGTLTLRETRPVVETKWTDSGLRHDRRGLKSREANTGRLFANERGGVLGSTSYWRVWPRPYALPPDKTDSPLAHRPYDLRHTCITNWLNAGVPVAEVSRRAGNSPEVVHRRYAGCIDGHEELNNRKIEKSMGGGEETSECAAISPENPLAAHSRSVRHNDKGPDQ